MPLIKKSSNSIWRVWSGPWKVGQKDNKKKVGVKSPSTSVRTE